MQKFSDKPIELVRINGAEDIAKFQPRLTSLRLECILRSRAGKGELWLENLTIR
jgi:hypothetical protein